WARNALRSSPRLAPKGAHDLIDAGPWRTVRTLRRALEDPIEDKLGEIEAPTLGVRPERARLSPAYWSARIAARIPDAELVVLPKASHSIGPRTAARLTALLAPFLAEAGDRGLEEQAVGWRSAERAPL